MSQVHIAPAPMVAGSVSFLINDVPTVGAVDQAVSAFTVLAGSAGFDATPSTEVVATGELLGRMIPNDEAVAALHANPISRIWQR
jgi:hypothetical protein